MLSPVMFSTAETRRVFSKIIPSILIKTTSQAKLKTSRIIRQSDTVKYDAIAFNKLSHMLDGFFKL